MSNIKLWMPLWVPDFMGDTTHLTAAEVGQYLLLLMAMWRNGGSLPAEPDRLALIARVDKVSPVVMAFFRSKNNTITQKRLTIEFERQKAYRKSQKQKALTRWNKRNLSSGNGKHDDAGAYAEDMPPNPNLNKRNNREKDEARQREALQEILDEQLSRTVLDYRHKRKQSNEMVAITRLVNQLKKWSNPREGAEEMICRGWSGFNPEWMESKRDAKKNGSNGHHSFKAPYPAFAKEAPAEKLTPEQIAERNAKVDALKKVLGKATDKMNMKAASRRRLT